MENFKTWFVSFLAKHPEKPQWTVDGAPVSTKLTGKQLFERGALALVDMEGLAASGEAAKGAAVDWGLFADEGDLPDDE